MERGPGRGAGQPAAERGRNYLAPVGSLSRTGSWKETAARNLDIIELAKRLTQAGEPATPEQQALLAQYTGWGPSEIRNKLFPVSGTKREINPYAVPADWRELAERARDLLTPEEFRTFLRSTQYAH